MSTLYFSLWSEDSEPLVKKIVAECETFLEAECVWGKDDEQFTPGKTKDRISRCEILIVVVSDSTRSSSLPVKNSLLKERIRAEIVAAINLDLTIIPLLIDDARLPDKENLPGALKRLLACKSYRVRSALWFEDLHEFLEDLQEELDFKKDAEEKLSQSTDFPDLSAGLLPLGLLAGGHRESPPAFGAAVNPPAPAPWQPRGREATPVPCPHARRDAARRSSPPTETA